MMENQSGDRAGALICTIFTIFAAITIKDMQAIVTIIASLVAIASGSYSLYVNFKKRNNKD